MESLGNFHILLVESDFGAAQATQDILSRWGLTVTTVSNGTDAVETTKTTTFDCILTEVKMPDIDGYETARIIRLLGDQFQQVPIIGFSGSVPDMRDKSAKDNVLDDFIVTPFDAATLHDMLKKYLDKDAPNVVRANLDRCTDGDAEFRKELASLLANNISELLINLESALKHNDPNILGRAIHKTKTTLSILGDGELNSQLGMLQKKIGQGSPDDLDIQVQKLNNRCRKTISILNTLSTQS